MFRGIQYAEPPSGAIRAAGDELRRVWTDFARHGDPGWPAFTGSGGPTCLLGTDGPEVVPYPEQRSRALWPVHDLGPFQLKPAVGPAAAPAGPDTR